MSMQCRKDYIHEAILGYVPPSQLLFRPESYSSAAIICTVHGVDLRLCFYKFLKLIVFEIYNQNNWAMKDNLKWHEGLVIQMQFELQKYDFDAR